MEAWRSLLYKYLYVAEILLFRRLNFYLKDFVVWCHVIKKRERNFKFMYTEIN